MCHHWLEELQAQTILSQCGLPSRMPSLKWMMRLYLLADQLTMASSDKKRKYCHRAYMDAGCYKQQQMESLTESWHKRLGHNGINTLEQIKNGGKVPSLPQERIKTLKICPDYFQGITARFPHIRVRSRKERDAGKRFMRVYANWWIYQVCGAPSIPSRHWTIGAGWIFLPPRTKSEGFVTLITLVAMAKRQTEGEV